MRHQHPALNSRRPELSSSAASRRLTTRALGAHLLLAGLTVTCACEAPAEAPRAGEPSPARPGQPPDAPGAALLDEAVVFPLPTQPDAAERAGLVRHVVEPPGLPRLAYRLLLPTEWRPSPPPETGDDPDQRPLGAYTLPGVDAWLLVDAIRLRAEITTTDWLIEHARLRRLELRAVRSVPRPVTPRVDLLATEPGGDGIVRLIGFRQGGFLVLVTARTPAVHAAALAVDLARAALWLEMQHPEASRPIGELSTYTAPDLGGLHFTYPSLWTAELRQRGPEHAVVDLTLRDAEHTQALIRLRRLRRPPGAPPFRETVTLERDALRRSGAAITTAAAPESTPPPPWAEAAIRAEATVSIGEVPSTLTSLVGARDRDTIMLSLWAPTADQAPSMRLIARGTFAMIWQTLRSSSDETYPR